MLGDHMLFMREDSVELAWSALTPLFENRNVPLHLYPAGSEGPDEARRMIERDGRSWRSL
jgi:glucose-6-phosphate 1-dehydrogenase